MMFTKRISNPNFAGWIVKINSHNGPSSLTSELAVFNTESPLDDRFGLFFKRFSKTHIREYKPLYTALLCCQDLMEAGIVSYCSSEGRYILDSGKVKLESQLNINALTTLLISFDMVRVIKILDALIEQSWSDSDVESVFDLFLSALKAVHCVQQGKAEGNVTFEPETNDTPARFELSYSVLGDEKTRLVFKDFEMHLSTVNDILFTFKTFVQMGISDVPVNLDGGTESDSSIALGSDVSGDESDGPLDEDFFPKPPRAIGGYEYGVLADDDGFVSSQGNSPETLRLDLKPLGMLVEPDGRKEETGFKTPERRQESEEKKQSFRKLRRRRTSEGGGDSLLRKRSGEYPRIKRKRDFSSLFSDSDTNDLAILAVE
ncbi:hypothetical protein ACFL96_20305 [Thermoproteota archaeon]